jgi:serine/threonine protein kinase
MAVAEETLRIIQALHELGMIHRDVKPSNFLLRPHSNAPLCLIDFGLAKRRRDCSKSCQPGERRFTGTVKYASPNAHKGMELAPRDDLYSWFYSMVELMGHNLPWENVKDQTECLRQKTVIDVTELCGNLPEKFKAIYGCILGLTYEEIPNYRRIFDLLNDARIEDRIPSDGAEWQALMRVIPEAIQLVPEETEQLGAPARRRRTAVDVGAPLISNDDGAHCPACFLL